jgi:hypothetical protein
MALRERIAADGFSLEPDQMLAAVRFHTFFGDGQAKGGLAICH